MSDLDSILHQLDDGTNLKNVRHAIANLIEHRLQLFKDSLGYWEKEHLANAISNLSCNISSYHQPTIFLLRLCLANVEKSLVPAEHRNESYTPRNKLIEELTYEQLIEAINSLRQTI